MSGGVGSRISYDKPKQYIDIGGRMMLTYPLMTMLSSGRFDLMCIVAEASWREAIDGEMQRLFGADATEAARSIIYADPGRNRQESILHAMEAADGVRADRRSSGDVSGSGDVVFIHDAARPFLTEDMIETILDAAAGHEGVLPVLPMKDTVYISEDGASISSLIDRQKVFAGQAPEAFLFDKYLEANKALMPDDILKINGSTEPAVMAGMDIVMVPGAEGNFKVTTDADLERASEKIMVAAGRTSEDY